MLNCIYRNRSLRSEQIRELVEAELDHVTGGLLGGQNVALNNHISGQDSASGNPNASAGPGYFFRNGKEVSEAVHEAQAGVIF